MEVKPTLRVINQADFPGRRGVTDGQTYQRLIGWPPWFFTVTSKRLSPVFGGSASDRNVMSSICFAAVAAAWAEGWAS